jgi:hypothetical protein
MDEKTNHKSVYQRYKKKDIKMLKLDWNLK